MMPSKWSQTQSCAKRHCRGLETRGRWWSNQAPGAWLHFGHTGVLLIWLEKNNGGGEVDFLCCLLRCAKRFWNLPALTVLPWSTLMEGAVAVQVRGASAALRLCLPKGFSQLFIRWEIILVHPGPLRLCLWLPIYSKLMLEGSWG